jgi:hypothetical protein
VKDEKKKGKYNIKFFFIGSFIGSASGLYRGIRETQDLTGSVRTSS